MLFVFGQDFLYICLSFLFTVRIITHFITHSKRGILLEITLPYAAFQQFHSTMQGVILIRLINHLDFIDNDGNKTGSVKAVLSLMFQE